MDAPPVAAPSATAASAEDLQQLKLLSIFHYVLSGITGLFSLFPLIHLFMGLAIVTGHLPMENTSPDAPPMDRAGSAGFSWCSRQRSSVAA
ncbi:hypothetical protein XBLMG947_3184 [Xanthomonas bromi]|uniref:Uncharacterized protein n=1 Tax=Xanthomonas bromi TaxID=56449 RepID=A0A1C3NPS8_9XANT|nr:hypothetical protein XBLMG947_3184 [Xanthomonas bromi]